MGKLTGVKRRGKKTFQIRYYDADGVRHYETVTARTATQAAGIRNARLADIAKGIPVSSRPNTVRFEELCADVVNHYIVNKLSSMSDIEARYRLHILPRLGKRKAATITTAQLNSYILSRQVDNPTPSTGTINRELEAIRRAFKFAEKGRKLLASPHIPMLRENNVRQGFFTREEVERLCSHLKPPLNSFVKFAFLTGWRYEEVRTLKWANVDFTSGEIRLEPGTTKNRQGRVFPMTNELRTLLGSLLDKRETHAVRDKAEPRKLLTHVKPTLMSTGAQFVFVIDNSPIGQFRKSWKAANHKAGLPCIYDTKGKVVKAVRVFHDLRRSAVKNLLAQGLTEREVMEYCGWISRSVLDRYHIIGPNNFKDALRKMNAANGDNFGDKSGSGNTGTQ